MKNLVNFKNSLITFFAVLLLVVVATFSTVSVNANTSGSNETVIFVNEGFTIPITVAALGENLSADGTYTATFKISEDWYKTTEPAKNVSFNLFTEKHVCKEGNGNIQPQGFCGGNMQSENTAINLNESNGYAQTVTFTTKQQPAQACGSFQTDLFYKENGGQDTLGWSWTRTGMDCVEVVPSPSPSPSISPSPSPSPSPSTVQCPTGTIQKIENSVVVCVAQNQNQEQTQTQNNDQNQTVNQVVNATGGSSSSTSSSSSNTTLTINNPATTNTVVKEVRVAASTATPQVVTQTKGDIKELPKTGLPLAALALGGLMPAGFGLKKFAKKQDAVSANSIWMERELNS
jgi:hypothetical protein